jgi:hypothetical protein
MEVIGLIASVTQLIAATKNVINYVEDVKDGPKERTLLLKETKLMLDVLIRLREAAESNHDGLQAKMQGLDEHLQYIILEMEKLVVRLMPKSTGLGRYLLWPRVRKQVYELISAINRAHTMIALVLSSETR